MVVAVGMTMTMGMDLEMDMKTKTDLSAMYAEMKMAVEAMGESEETNMEIYGVMEDGELISYAYESTTDTWVRTQQEGYGEMLEQLRGMQQSMSSQPKELMSLAEEKATVNDRACYVLTLEMSGEHFQTYMSDYMGTMMSQLTGTEELLDQEAMDMMDQMDWSALSAKMVNYVDAETFLPLESTMEIMGMGETISGLFAEMMQMVEGEDMELTIDVPALKIITKNMIYNEAVEIPAVPQEAIDNAIDADAVLEDTGDEFTGDEFTGDEEWLTNEPQADGSYLLTSGTDSVSVFLPEGYSVFMADPEMVVGMTEDMMNSISFMLVTDVTAADMKAQYDASIELAKQEEYYLSHSELESVNGFEQVTITYNDGTAETSAWREVSGGILLVTGSAFGDAPVLDEVLNAIVFAE